MEYPDFSFYNSENDGYRGGFGDYTDPIPTSGGPAHPSEPPKKKGRGKRIAALLLACAVVGGGAGVGGAAVYQSLTAPDRKSTRLNSSHRSLSRMPSSA